MSVSEEQEQSKKRQWLIRLRFILMCKKPSADENMLHRIHVHSEATTSPVMKCKPRHGRCRWVTELIGSHEKLSVVWMNQAKILKSLQSTTQPHPPPEPYQTDSLLGLRKPAEGRAKAHMLFAILPSGITWRVLMLKDPRVGALSMTDCSYFLHKDYARRPHKRTAYCNFEPPWWHARRSLFEKGKDHLR